MMASALAVFGTGVWTFEDRKKHSVFELVVLGAGGCAFVGSAFGLVLWSGFHLSFLGIHIPGPYWVLAGMFVVVIFTRK